MIVTAALGVTEREGGLMMAEAAMTARSFACFRASSRHVLNSCFFVAVKSLICACIMFRCRSTAESSVCCISGG